MTHVNWHRALFHVQLGEFEQALTLWDDVIVKDATKCKCMKYITYISSKIEFYSCIQFFFPYQNLNYFFLKKEMNFFQALILFCCLI